MDDARREDDEFVRRAQAGSDEAFTALVHRHHERVHRTVLRIVRDPDDAEEVTQDTFIRAAGALDRFDFRAAFPTWLTSIARNAAFDALRSAKRRARHLAPFEDVDPAEPEGASDPLLATARGETAEIIGRALQRLNARDRALLVLREYEDLQYEEIARVLGCSVGTVESGIHRARKKLRRLLEPALDRAADDGAKGAG